jgi:hypothetical protein
LSKGSQWNQTGDYLKKYDIAARRKPMPDNKEQSTSVTTDEGQTPVEESQRKPGANIKTDAKETAKAESGEGGNNGVVGAPNQGTPTR